MSNDSSSDQPKSEEGFAENIDVDISNPLEGLGGVSIEGLLQIGVTLHHPNLTSMDASVAQLYGVIMLDEELASANAEMYNASLMACATYFIYRKHFCEDIDRMLLTLYESLRRETTSRGMVQRVAKEGSPNGNTIH